MSIGDQGLLSFVSFVRSSWKVMGISTRPCQHRDEAGDEPGSREHDRTYISDGMPSLQAAATHVIDTSTRISFRAPRFSELRLRRVQPGQLLGRLHQRAVMVHIQGRSRRNAVPRVENTPNVATLIDRVPIFRSPSA